jgi:hypothetical protein
MYFFSNSPVKWRLTKVVCWMRQLAVVDENGRVPLPRSWTAFADGQYFTPGQSRGNASLNAPFLYLHRQQVRA